MLLQRPGAYIERADSARSNQLLIRSDIAAFVGIAEKGPLNMPVPVESFKQFQAHFGGFIGAAFLAYSVRAYFENGGRRCWIVRVANVEDAGTAEYRVRNTSGNPAWSIRASSPGVWGNRLQVALLEQSAADSAILTRHSSPLYSTVTSTAGFQRGSLAVISQTDSAGVVNTVRKVVSFVDEPESRLYWVHPQPGQGLTYDAPAIVLDANLPARITSASYRLDVMSDGQLLASYDDLSLVPEHPNYGPAVLPPYDVTPAQKSGGSTAEVSRPVVISALVDSGSTTPDLLDVIDLQPIALTGGEDGLRNLAPNDFIGAEFDVNDSDSQRTAKRRGLAALHEIDEVTLLAVPDIVIRPDPDPEYDPEPEPQFDPCVPCPPPPEQRQPFVPPVAAVEMPPVFSEEQIYLVQAAMIMQCESRGDRFAVLDPPFAVANDRTVGMAAVQSWRRRFDSSYAALYFPWLKVVEPRATQRVRSIPPSGHTLGCFAFFDNATGVHRAPANRPLGWCQDLTLHTAFGHDELLNSLGINVVRAEGSRGLRIMGARTVSSDPDWRYVNVRRLMIMIRRTLEIISQWVVFEPNNPITRNKIRVAISSYLGQLWQRGALSGATADEAYFVKCDEENNPSFQKNNGELLAEVGIAPSNPFEFIVVRVGVQEQELIINELRNAA